MSSVSDPLAKGETAPLHDGGFHTILNFRDVGATINANVKSTANATSISTTSPPLLKEGILFRSARPDEATLADRDRLRNHYDIRTIMDLRSKTEHSQAAEKRAALQSQPDVVAKNPALSEPARIPGITYRDVKITGPGFEKRMLSQLSWSSFFKLISLYSIGHRTSAIAILGREVMTPRGLSGLAKDTLDASGPEIAIGLRSLLPSSSTSTPTPILVHCTQGKDRTGLMITLLLLICRVPATAIEQDYELTDEKLAEERGQRLDEIREMGLSEEFGRTAPGFVQGVTAHLEEKYGGLDGYLNGIGFCEGEREALRRAMLA
ncbi:tyrosine/serine protein phosphatase-like protein [Coniella lustricola]|uniref:Tyrosine/serine protein phosphatase-like protein n=1 Tax=Coniella lustricola TaxID=2025994 RepID=A0A2T2ZXS8_9PEZI|nr:tyrosine/serine protein phosphatase-like protein [Coniella lustricola]